MKLTFLGTAAANAYPEAFCTCRNCQRAREDPLESQQAAAGRGPWGLGRGGLALPAVPSRCLKPDLRGPRKACGELSNDQGGRSQYFSRRAYWASPFETFEVSVAIAAVVGLAGSRTANCTRTSKTSVKRSND